MSSEEISHTLDGEVYWQSFSSLLSGRIELSQTRVTSINGGEERCKIEKGINSGRSMLLGMILSFFLL